MRSFLRTVDAMTLLLLAVSAPAMVSTDQISYKETFDGIAFGNMLPNGLTNGDALTSYRDVQLDLTNLGNILFIGNNTIYTVAPEGTPELLAGQSTAGYLEGQAAAAQFNHPFSIFQLSSSETLVVDTGNFCIRSINRVTNRTRTYAGKCTEAGSITGHQNSGRFGGLLDIARLPEILGGHLIISDSNPNNCLYSINPTTLFSTIYVKLYMTPIGLTLDPTKQNLYFTFGGGIGKINVVNRDIEYLTDIATLEYGHVDGPIATAKFSPSPVDLKFITNDLILVADHLNNVLRCIDLRLRSVSTICKSVTNYNLPSSGSVSQCSLLGPLAILVQPSDSRIVAGSSIGLGYLTFQEDQAQQSTSESRITVMQGSGASTSKIKRTKQPGATAVSTTLQTPGKKQSNDGKNTGIVRGVAGGVAGFALIVAVIISLYFLIRHQNQHSSSTRDPPADPAPPAAQPGAGDEPPDVRRPPGEDEYMYPNDVADRREGDENIYSYANPAAHEHGDADPPRRAQGYEDEYKGPDLPCAVVYA